MAKQTKPWHSNFLKYMKFIINHENYEGLPIDKSDDGSYRWIATAKSEIGKKRKEWALQKAKDLGIENKAGVFAKVMLEIHPTKEKVCQVCGKIMSLKYIYPNTYLVKGIWKKFKFEIDTETEITKIVSNMIDSGIKENDLKCFFVTKFSLNLEESNISLDRILDLCEEKSRSGKSGLLGPGAMSNFPDRFDGFHTYNRCCRSTEDKGRSKANLRSYTKDRRAYENWSDGNIHAANTFMGSSFFCKTSADHIGPISLGFVHDPRYLRPMSSGDNSSKRDRLLFDDVEEMISIEEKTKVEAISWHSRIIWMFIKGHFKEEDVKLNECRNALKVNISTYLEILWIISNCCEGKGKEFLLKMLLEPKLNDFSFNYEFSELGEIISKRKRNFTKATLKEKERFVRIAFDALEDFHKKENRHIKANIEDISKEIKKVCADISSDSDFVEILHELEEIMISLQMKILLDMFNYKSDS